METNQGFIKRKLSRITPELNSQIEIALSNPMTYDSHEKRAILTAALLMSGIIVAAVILEQTIDWNEVFKLAGENRWEEILNRHTEFFVFVFLLSAILMNIIRLFRIHNRYGYVLLPGALGKIIGNYITMVPFENIEKGIYLDPATPSASGMDTGARKGGKLGLKMKNGTTISFFNIRLDLSAIQGKLVKRKI